MTELRAVDRMVDWQLAASTAARLAGRGPDTSPDEVADVVTELRDHAAASTTLVHKVTGLDVGENSGDVLVVDRRRWIEANVDGFRDLLAPVVEDAVRRREAEGKPVTSGATASIGRAATGAEVGALLAFIATKVLGQYDAFAGLDPARALTADAAPHPPAPGRLLLVAPNIVQAERELGADTRDFRLWVCLHEETHRVQFAAAPWLRDHLATRIRSMVGGLLVEPSQSLERLVQALRQAPGLLRGDGGENGLVDLVQTPEQREELAAVTAIMSLLEGHADVVMDDVGPSVIPSVASIRQAFTRRRAGIGPVDVLLRRLLGLEAKARQYRDGARFVRAAVDRVGMEGLNAVFASADALPRATEIGDPDAWVARVHG